MLKKIIIWTVLFLAGMSSGVWAACGWSPTGVVDVGGVCYKFAVSSCAINGSCYSSSGQYPWQSGGAYSFGRLNRPLVRVSWWTTADIIRSETSYPHGVNRIPDYMVDMYTNWTVNGVNRVYNNTLEAEMFVTDDLVVNVSWRTEWTATFNGTSFFEDIVNNGELNVILDDWSLPDRSIERLDIVDTTITKDHVTESTINKENVNRWSIQVRGNMFCPVWCAVQGVSRSGNVECYSIYWDAPYDGSRC